MTLPALSLDGEGALHRQLYRSIRAGILGGRIAAGTRLPSSRELAEQAELSRNTVIRAYEQLVAEGYAESRRGAGTFVAGALPADGARPRAPGRAARTPPVSAYARRALEAVAPWGASWDIPRRGLEFDFRYAEPSYVDFPHETWARINGARLRRASVRRLSYSDPGGAPELREALAGYLGRARGVACTPEQVLVVRGSQQGIDLAIRVLLDPGAPVVLEEPHYPGFRWALLAAGAAVTTVPVDEHGLDVAALKDVQARLVVVTPSHQYPTGVIMPLARRMELLGQAERAEAWVLEDDYDGEYRYDGAPIESLQGVDGGRRVLYAGTMSKVMFPSLRIGYLVLPEHLVHAFRAAQALVDTGAAGIEQLALAQFIAEGHFERHLRRSRQRHAARRAALLEAVEEHLGDAVTVSGENAGLHLLLWLEGFSEARARGLRRAAARRGVGVYPANACFTTRPRRPALLLGYSGLDEARIREGIRRLGELVREALRSGTGR